MQQPGVGPAALATRRFPHQRCNGLTGERWRAGSCALPGREAAGSATHGLPAGHALVAGCGFPQCCPAAVAADWAGWAEVACPH